MGTGTNWHSGPSKGAAEQILILRPPCVCVTRFTGQVSNLGCAGIYSVPGSHWHSPRDRTRDPSFILPRESARAVGHLCTPFRVAEAPPAHEQQPTLSNCDVNEPTDAKMEGARWDGDSGDSREGRRQGVEGAVHLVEVVEGRPELLHLLLADALGVAGEDLVLDLVDGAGDGGEQLLPAHADVLREEHGR